MATRSISSSRFLVARTTQKSLYVPGAAQIIPFIPSASGFNIGFWFRGMPFTVAYRNIIYSLNASVDGFKLDLPNTNYGYMEAQMFNASAVTVNANAGALIIPSDWHYITLTFVPNSFKVYYDAVLKFTDSSCSMSVAGLTNTQFGASLLNAFFAKITLHNRDTAWTTTEIQNLMYRDVIPSGAKYYSLNNTNLDQDGANAITLSGTSYSTNVPSHMNVRSAAGSRFLLPTTAQKSISILGSSGRIETSTNIASQINSSYTIAAWIKRRTLGSSQAFFKNIDVGDKFWFNFQSDNTIRIYHNDLFPTSSLTTVKVGNYDWHHIVGTYNGSNIKIYLDNVKREDRNVTGTLTLGSNPLMIFGGQSNSFNGLGKNARIWNRALTEEEITNLFYKDVCPTSGLLLKYNTNEGSGSTIADSSGNGNGGSFAGSPSPSWSTDAPFQPRSAI